MALSENRFHADSFSSPSYQVAKRPRRGLNFALRVELLEARDASKRRISVFILLISEFIRQRINLLFVVFCAKIYRSALFKIVFRIVR